MERPFTVLGLDAATGKVLRVVVMAETQEAAAKMAEANGLRLVVVTESDEGDPPTASGEEPRP